VLLLKRRRHGGAEAAETAAVGVEVLDGGRHGLLRHVAGAGHHDCYLRGHGEALCGWAAGRRAARGGVVGAGLLVLVLVGVLLMVLVVF
jgi:hypothetical protein